VEACIPHFLAEYTQDMLRRFSEERESSGKPFLIFLSFWGPHVLYHIPEPYSSMYDPGNIEMWPSWKDSLEGKPRVQARRARFNADFSEARWKNMIAKHWGFCSFIDDEIGRVLDALDTMGRREDTVVLFSVDHGNMIGSHGGLHDKGPWMYEETYHIPLMIRAPWLAKPSEVCSRFVYNMDLATTVLDLAGAGIPESHDGRSLVPLLHDPNAEWRDDMMAEFHGHRFLYSQRMIRWKNYKYIFTPGDMDELYDLDADPYELTNRIQWPDHVPVIREGRRRLIRWFDDSRDPLGSPDIRWELEHEI
jgi:arylsulfatase A-like enzyme